MTRRPDCDERLVVPTCSVVYRNRVYLRDLSRFLGHRMGPIVAYAKSNRLLKKAYCGHMHYERYVTEWGAMLIIAHIRALQEQWCLKWKREHFHEAKAKAAARWVPRKDRVQASST